MQPLASPRSAQLKMPFHTRESNKPICMKLEEPSISQPIDISGLQAAAGRGLDVST